MLRSDVGRLEEQVKGQMEQAKKKNVYISLRITKSRKELFNVNKNVSYPAYVGVYCTYIDYKGAKLYP